jgi:prefoldin alpha subunit
MAASSSSSDKPRQIASLNLQELQQVKKSIEENLEELSTQKEAMDVACLRLSNSKESLVALTPSNQGKQILIPLTSAMYVPAYIEDSSSVLVDIGTGYFVQQSIGGAANFINRQLKMLQANAEHVQKQLDLKTEQHQSVVMVMQQKIAAIAQQQQPSR